MPDPINIPVQNGNVYATAAVSSQNWIVIPQEMFVYWFMNANTPNPITIFFKYPNYQSVPALAGYTDWQFESSSVHQSFFIVPSPSIPFTQMNGEDVHVGELGFLSGGNYTKSLAYSFVNLNLLSEGQYLIKTTIKITAVNPLTGFREIITTKDHLIYFYANAFSFALQPPFEITYPGKVISFTDFSVISQMVFNYTIGGSLPAPQDVYYFTLPPTNAGAPSIVTTSNVALVANWVGIHPYYSKVALDFSSAIESLAEGVYTYTFQIGYAAFGMVPELRKTVDVVLNVLPEGGSTFQINPDELDFEVVIGGQNTLAQAVAVTSENPWEIISEFPNWLAVSQLDGDGNTTLFVSIINTHTLAEGDFYHTIVFSDGTVNRTITVHLNVIYFLINPFTPGKLNFTKDEDYLQFISQNNNIYIELILAITIYKLNSNESVVYERAYSIPLANKRGNFHIGSIVHELLDEIQSLEQMVPDTNSNYFRIPYKPAEVSFTYEEKEFEAALVPPTLVSGSVTGILFLKGRKPYMTENELGILSVQQQSISRISRYSILGFNFTAAAAPTVLVKVNNLPIEQIDIAAFGPANHVFSYYRFINDLRPGDYVEIYVFAGSETRSHRYLVHHDGLESTFLLFENENGVVEPFELSGRRRVYGNFKHTNQPIMKGLEEVEAKVITDDTQSIIVNTGQLHPEDILIIESIVKSEKLWVSFTGPEGTYKQANCSSTKVLSEDTSSTETSLDLEFNII